VIAFASIAALMVAAALAWVLVPLMRRHGHRGIDRETSNLVLLREQRQDLDSDLARGTLTPERYTQAIAELERNVLEETMPADAPAATGSAISSTWTAVVLAAGIPILSVVLYLTLGSRDAFVPAVANAPVTAAEHDITPAEIEAMAAQLTAKLQQEPNNAEGWVMLARTYYALKRFPDAAHAFERAVALVPDNAALLSDYADALGSAQGGTLAGKPQELIARALKADPNYWKALALAGTAAFDAKDYAKAAEYWERTKATVPQDSDFAKGLDASIAEARGLGGISAFSALPSGTAPAPGKPAPVASTAPASGKSAAGAPPASPAATTGNKAVAGTVRLAPALAAQADPGDTVFIFARAAEGPKMPLAIVRKQVKDLPYAFTLDDTTAMAPNMALSNFPQVVIGARISKTGNAAPQSGDFEGISAPVKPGAAGVAVVIATRLP
jgi:cytochrome c-type biogenesis protein CcmH